MLYLGVGQILYEVLKRSLELTDIKCKLLSFYGYLYHLFLEIFEIAETQVKTFLLWHIKEELKCCSNTQDLNPNY